MKLLLMLLFIINTLFAYEGHNKWIGVFAQSKSIKYTDQKLYATLFWDDFRKRVKENWKDGKV